MIWYFSLFKEITLKTTQKMFLLFLIVDKQKIARAVRAMSILLIVFDSQL